jgi:hypothetical protein
MAQFPISDLLDGTRSQAVKLIESKAEIKVFNKNNPLAPRVAGDYELREASAKDHYLPQMIHAIAQEGHSEGDIRNIIEQCIIITSTLDKPITITFGITYSSTSSSFFRINRQTIWEMPAGNTNRKTAILVPEKGTFLLGTTPHTQTFEISELRQPYPAFFIGLAPVEAPTAGEIEMLVCRRF